MRKRDCRALRTIHGKVNERYLAVCFGPRRSGPKKAPRTHMGKPYWIPSYHFTVTSPRMREREMLELSRRKRKRNYRAYWSACQGLHELNHEFLGSDAWYRRDRHRRWTTQVDEHLELISLKIQQENATLSFTSSNLHIWSENSNTPFLVYRRGVFANARDPPWSNWSPAVLCEWKRHDRWPKERVSLRLLENLFTFGINDHLLLNVLQS